MTDERPMMDPIRKPGQADLERVVGHFLYYLSNTPGSDGISPRQRLYGTLPIESKLLFPDLSDDIITSAVQAVLNVTRRQKDVIPRTDAATWRSYS